MTLGERNSHCQVSDHRMQKVYRDSLAASFS